MIKIIDEQKIKNWLMVKLSISKNIITSIFLLMVIFGCNDVTQEHILIEDASSDAQTKSNDIPKSISNNEKIIQPSETEVFAAEIEDINLAPNIDNSSDDTSFTTNDNAVNSASDEDDMQLDSAVLTLINDANNHQLAGNLSMAIASLERAQRIAPREPYVLYTLAKANLAKGDAAAAEQIATRALFYTASKPKLQSKLWYLIADCRTSLGNHIGAVNATEQAKLQKW